METAEEIFYKMLQVNDECTSIEMMIEFAKMHVKAALDAADKEVPLHCSEGVLNCYPESNIK